MYDTDLELPHLLIDALAFSLIAAITIFGNRTYRKDYLRTWTAVWLLLTGASLLLYGLRFVSTGGPRWILITLIGALTGTIAWRMLGAGFLMALRRPLPRTRSLTLIGALAGIGAIASLLIGGGENGALRIEVLMSLSIATSAFLAALLMGWERRRHLAPGFLVCAAAFLLFGVTIGLDGIRVAGLLDSPWIHPAVLFSIVTAGCSTLLFAAEDDRQAALLAATQIEHIAYYDPLTGLPNRSLFLDRLIGLVTSNRQERAAVLFIDIDRLKEINDLHGHATGDAVIRAIAKRIRSSVRSSDTAARYAGDEFVVLLDQISDPAAASGVAEKLLKAIEHPVVSGTGRVETSGSIGVAIFPDHGITAEDLIRNADAAMYAAKTAGRNRYRLFEPAAESSGGEREELEHALRDAIEQKELTVCYQPIVRLSDGTVRGVEALVRWEDPVRGSISPSEFIPIAESTRLIAPLGELVLHQVCRDLQTVFEPAVVDPTFFVSVNLSPEQFADADLVPRIRRALETTGADGGRIQFEVAESTASLNPVRSTRTFTRMREAGVRLAIDCFGTASMTIPALTVLPIDSVKIDRSIMADHHRERNEITISAIATIARHLGLTVVAEGIETETHRDVAIREGCTYGQGFHFGSAVSAEQIIDLLLQRTSPERDTRSRKPSDADISLVSSDTSTRRDGDLTTVTLVIDDDVRMRNLMAVLLRRVGHEVLTAEDGRRGLDVLKTVDPNRIGAIALDLMMPRMSGWQVLDAIAETMPWLSSRVLLVTAAGTDEIKRIDRALYGEVIEKPFDQADFYDAVARCSHNRADPLAEDDNGDGDDKGDGEPHVVH